MKLFIPNLKSKLKRTLLSIVLLLLPAVTAGDMHKHTVLTPEEFKEFEKQARATLHKEKPMKDALLKMYELSFPVMMQKQKEADRKIEILEKQLLEKDQHEQELTDKLATLQKQDEERRIECESLRAQLDTAHEGTVMLEQRYDEAESVLRDIINKFGTDAEAYGNRESSVEDREQTGLPLSAAKQVALLTERLQRLGMQGASLHKENTDTMLAIARNHTCLVQELEHESAKMLTQSLAAARLSGSGGRPHSNPKLHTENENTGKRYDT